MITRNFLSLLSILFFGLFLFACDTGERSAEQNQDMAYAEDTTAQDDFGTDGPIADEAETATMLEKIEAQDDYSVLLQALKSAKMEDVLTDNGPYTFFAPKNEAFENLPEGVTVEALLQEENAQQLEEILNYHIVPGNIISTDFTDGMVLTTLSGRELVVKEDGGNLVINESIVVSPDMESANGIIHGLDRVLLPTLK